MGVWDDVTGAPDHDWLAGSNANYPNGLELITPDTGNWRRFSLDFVVAGDKSVFLMLEDFVYSANATAGDAYFDNIELQVVPEPSAAFLVGFGLVGMAAGRRLKRPDVDAQGQADRARGGDPWRAPERGRSAGRPSGRPPQRDSRCRRGCR